LGLFLPDPPLVTPPCKRLNEFALKDTNGSSDENMLEWPPVAVDTAAVITPAPCPATTAEISFNPTAPKDPVEVPVPPIPTPTAPFSFGGGLPLLIGVM
jgi:hypothetical protein